MANKKRESMRDAMQERAKERKSGGGSKYLKLPDGVDFFKPPKNKTISLDILPYEVSIEDHPEGRKSGQLWYRKQFQVHTHIGPEDEWVVCPKTNNEPCPICEEYVKLKNELGWQHPDVKALKFKLRELFNVINLNDDDEAILLWDVSFHLFGEDLEKEMKTAELGKSPYCFDIEDRTTLEVRFQEASRGGFTFVEADRIDAKDGDDYEEDILEDVLDLDEILLVPSYDEVAGKFFGSVEPDTPTSEDEPEDGSSGRRRKRKKADEKEPTEEPAEPEPPENEANDEDCPECDGEGKNKRGRKCKECGGSGKVKKEAGDDAGGWGDEGKGKKKEPAEEPAEPEPPKEEKASRRKRRGKDDSSDKGKKAEPEEPKTRRRKRKSS